MGLFLKFAIFCVIVAIGVQVYIKIVAQDEVGEASRREVVFGPNDKITIERNELGLMQIWAKDALQMAKGVGYVHAKDRLVQLYLIRTIMQGRMSELLLSNEQTLKIDTIMRKIGFYHYAKLAYQNMDEEGKSIYDSYSQGVNQYLKENHSLPLEFKISGFAPEEWKPVDSIGILKLIGYLGLAETQQNAEKIVIESMQDSDEAYRMWKAVLSPHFDDFSEEVMELVKKLKVEERLFEVEIPLPKIRASNNWAVAAAKSVTGSSLYASDPHLNTLQLPPIWYEVISYVSEYNNYAFGITLPGMPGVLMGRTKYISYGFTYGFMDMIDYYIEDCKEEKCKYGNEFLPIEKRVETIKRKGERSVEVVLYQTKHGQLELGNVSRHGFDDGLYLAKANSLQTTGFSKSVKAAAKDILFSRTAKDAQFHLRNVEISTNMIIIDRENNLVYQQTGSLPVRPHTGLSPLVGWDPKNDWSGSVPAEELTSFSNPSSGIIASANNFFFTENKPLAVNLHMGSYRVDRIEQLLNEKEKLSVDDMKRIQGDLISLQAKRFMEVLKPVLPNNTLGNLLANWNFEYSTNSREAVLFEEFYKSLLKDVFIRPLKNKGSYPKIEHHIGGVFFHKLDDFLFEYSPKHDDLLWKGETRDQLFRRVISKVLEGKDAKKLPTYGETRTTTMQNLFFSGKLGWVGRALGIDYGKFEVPGSRSTVCQGQYWQEEDGREQSFAPSWRFVTDIATDEAYTVIPGGNSGNLFSQFYSNEAPMWLNNQHKKVKIL